MPDPIGDSTLADERARFPLVFGLDTFGVPGLDRRGRQCRVRSARCPSRLRAHARHYRRTPGALCAFSQLFYHALDDYGQPARPVGVHAPGHIAATDEQAREQFWPRYLEVIRHVSQTRGFAVPTKESFLREIGPQGALYVGSPETVAQKIAASLPALGATRLDLKYGMGALSHEVLMTNIELYGTQVISRVRDVLASSSSRQDGALERT